MAGRKGEATVTETLKEAIRASGRSLNQLAKASGVGSDRLSRFMRGQRSLTSGAIDSLCTALGLRLVGPAQAAEPAPQDAGPAKRGPKPGGRGRQKGATHV
jgi:transcriptional regulator with XRE-family HTH domain